VTREVAISSLSGFIPPDLKLAKQVAIPRLMGSFIYMFLSAINAWFALAPPATQGGQSQAPAWTSLVPLVLLMVVFYFALIRPQQKKAKEHAQLLKNIRSGDKVLTSGGIIATVITVKEKSITIRSADTKLEVTKSAVSEITERSGSEPTES
jgi:preprotein translocase subunit YajC